MTDTKQQCSECQGAGLVPLTCLPGQHAICHVCNGKGYVYKPAWSAVPEVCDACDGTGVEKKVDKEA